MFFESNILLKENNIKQKSGGKKSKKSKLKKSSLKILKNLNSKKNVSKIYKIIIITTFVLFFLIAIFLFIFLKSKKKEMNNIPIAFSLNEKYVYPLIVVLTSILYNSILIIFSHFISYYHQIYKKTV